MSNTAHHLCHLVIIFVVLVMSLVTLIRKRDVVNTDCDHEHHGFAFVTIALVSNVLAVVCLIFILSRSAKKTTSSASSGSSSALSNFLSWWRCSAQSAKEMLLDVAFFCSFLWGYGVTSGLGFWGISLLVNIGIGSCMELYEEGKLCDIHTEPLGIVCESTSLYGLIIIHTIFLLLPLVLTIAVGFVYAIIYLVRAGKRRIAARRAGGIALAGSESGSDGKSAEDNEATPLLETA
ncbi:hypothetical protein QOT17_015640 [Balamuthia mandrillaris]